jgi:Flp pilus assembly protein TadD
VTWYEQALEVQPKNASAMNNLGYAELRAGDANSALKHIQRSIEINPSNSYAFRNLGHVWKEMGDLEKACEAYKQALDLGFTNRYGPEVKQHYETYCR